MVMMVSEAMAKQTLHSALHFYWDHGLLYEWDDMYDGYLNLIWGAYNSAFDQP